MPVLTVDGVQSGAEMLAALSPQDRDRLLNQFSPVELDALRFDWGFWGRPKQQLPQGNWFTWLILAGRGFGKTRTGSETVRDWVEKMPTGHTEHLRIALVAETSADARDVLVQGDSGIIACSRPEFMPKYEPSKRRLTWPCGCQATTYSGEEPGQLRGPQFHKAWVDELAKYKYPTDAWDNLEFGLRLGNNPQVVVTTTPRPIPIVRQIHADPQTITTAGSSYENYGNLAPKFIERVIKKYEGTRLGRQELHAEILSDTPGALWRLEDLENSRIVAEKVPDMVRLVVAVDPAMTSDAESSNETGIVVVGKCAAGFAYILEDASGVYTADQWARKAISLYDEYAADRVVAEVNNGGNLVEDVIRTRAPRISYKAVRASRGKARRAEPVAALYEQGKVKHVGVFAAMEDQMLLTTSDEYLGSGSPDRMDAAVWGVTDLMLGSQASRDPDKYKTYRR